MLLLAIDTVAPTGSIAVLRDEALLGEISTASDEAYSSRLFRQLDFLLRELQLETKDFGVFAVAAGPGSFTGLRVGLAAVKAWAEVFNKPIVAISGLEAVAAQAQIMSADGLIAPILDARRGQIFGGLYRPEDIRLAQVEAEQVCTLEEFLAQLAQRQDQAGTGITFISPHSPILEQLTGEIRRDSSHNSHPLRIQSASPVLAPIIGRLAFERAARGEFTDALRLDANYIRRSDAELLWKTR